MYHPDGDYYDEEVDIAEIDQAIKAGDFKSLRNLFDYEDNRNWLIHTRQNEHSPLVNAVRQHKLSLLKSLVRFISRAKNIPEEKIITENQHLLHQAIIQGHDDIFDYIIANKKDINLTKYNPLHAAALYSRPQMVVKLLKQGANLSSPLWPVSPYKVIPKDNNKNYVQQLMDDIKIAINDDNVDKLAAALHDNAPALIKYAIPIAIELDKPKTLIHLLDAQKKSIPSPEMITYSAMLSKAIRSKSYSAIETLLNKNVDLSIADKNNQTPLHYAVMHNDIKAAILILKKLSDQPASLDINKPDIFGLTPLDHAALNKNQFMHDTLIQYSQRQMIANNNSDLPRVDSSSKKNSGSFNDAAEKLRHNLKSAEPKVITEFLRLMPNNTYLIDGSEAFNKINSTAQVLNMIKNNPDITQYLLKNDHILSLFKKDSNAGKDLIKTLVANNLLWKHKDEAYNLMKASTNPIRRLFEKALDFVFNIPQSRQSIVRIYFNDNFKEKNNLNYWMKGQAEEYGHEFGGQANIEEAVKNYEKITKDDPILYLKSLQQLMQIYMGHGQKDDAENIIKQISKFYKSEIKQRYKYNAEVVEIVNHAKEFKSVMIKGKYNQKPKLDTESENKIAEKSIEDTGDNQLTYSKLLETVARQNLDTAKESQDIPHNLESSGKENPTKKESPDLQKASTVIASDKMDSNQESDEKLIKNKSLSR